MNDGTRPVSRQAAAIGVFGAAALIAASTAGAPTGIASWDAILRFIMASGLVVAGTRSGQLVALPACAAVLLVGGPALVVALASISYLGMAVAAFVNKDSALLRAGVATTAVWGALSLPPVWFFGAPSLVAAAVCLPIVIGGYRSLGAPRRRHATRIAAGTAAMIGIATVAAGATLLPARGAADSGITSARQAIEALTIADQSTADSLVVLAEENLERAERSASRWWVQPARLIPVVGQHVSSFQAAARPALHATQAARLAIELLDAEQLRSGTGGVDLAAVTLLGTHVASVHVALEQVQTAIATPSPWLIRPVATRLADAEGELDETLSQVGTAVDVLSVVPSLLGSDGPRRYLIAIATPAEARELGGIVANWVEIELDDGELVQSTHGRNSDLAEQVEPLDDRTKYPRRYLDYQPARFPQNLTGTPDFPTAAQAMAEVYNAGSRDSIDGVVYLDAFVLASMLELTGPLEFTAIDEPLRADNALDFLLVGQYERFSNPSERIDFLGELSRLAVERVVAMASPTPQRVINVLGPAVRQGRLQFWSFDTNAQAALSSLEISGRFGPAGPGDFLSVVHSNGAATKLDTFLHRDIHYEVSLDPDSGRMTATVEVRLTNSATPELPGYVLGEPGTTTNRAVVSLYTPHVVVAAYVDGELQIPESHVEYGLRRHMVLAEVSPDAPGLVVIELEGQIDLAGDSYVLQLDHQPLVNNDDFTMSVELTEGTWLPSSDFDTTGATAVAIFELGEDKVLRGEFAHPQ